MRWNSEESSARVQVKINTHTSVIVETHLSSHRRVQGVLVEYSCGMSQLGAVVAKKLMWSHASLMEMEHSHCGLCLACYALCEADRTKSSTLSSRPSSERSPGRLMLLYMGKGLQTPLGHRDVLPGKQADMKHNNCL